MCGHLSQLSGFFRVHFHVTWMSPATSASTPPDLGVLHAYRDSPFIKLEKGTDNVYRYKCYVLIYRKDVRLPLLRARPDQGLKLRTWYIPPVPRPGVLQPGDRYSKHSFTAITCYHTGLTDRLFPPEQQYLFKSSVDGWSSQLLARGAELNLSKFKGFGFLSQNSWAGSVSWIGRTCQ